MSKDRYFDVWDLVGVAIIVLCVLGVCATLIADDKCAQCFKQCPEFQYTPSPQGKGEKDE